jgi:uncharacterized protein YbcC (UPF0753/DUF2309 family)
MERESKNYKQLELVDILYEKLSDLYDLEEKGWKVNSAIEKIKEQIGSILHEAREERLSELRDELEDERKRMSSTNP